MQSLWIGLAAALGAIVVLLIWRHRSRGEVIDAPRPGSPERPAESLPAPTAAATTATPVTEGWDTTAGELVRSQGGDAYLEALATWIEDRALEDLGGDVTQQQSTRRIVNAARQALDDLRAHGRATVLLPALVADATGAKDFHRELVFTAIDRMLVEDFELGVRDILRAHGEDTQVVALGAYLMSQASEMAGHDLDRRVDTVQRMADATRIAWTAYFQTGRAEVVVPRFNEELAFDFRYTVDQQVMQKAVAALGASERA